MVVYAPFGIQMVFHTHGKNAVEIKASGVRVVIVAVTLAMYLAGPAILGPMRCEQKTQRPLQVKAINALYLDKQMQMKKKLLRLSQVVIQPLTAPD